MKTKKRVVRCGLCDMAKATKYRIPACKRPATHWIPDQKWGGRLYMCHYHWKRNLPGGR